MVADDVCFYRFARNYCTRDIESTRDAMQYDGIVNNYVDFCMVKNLVKSSISKVQTVHTVCN